MVEILATAFVTFFVVVDPISLVPIFLSLTASEDIAERRRIAVKATVVAAIILIAFAVGGDALLRALGISMAAFRIAGGSLLFLLSIDMVLARQTGLRSTTSGEQAEAVHRSDVSVFPIAIPLISGPGAISSIILLVGAQRGDLVMQGAMIATMLVVLVVNLVALLAASSLMRRLGLTGINVVGRVFGIVLAALASQFVLDGIREAFRLA